MKMKLIFIGLALFIFIVLALLLFLFLSNHNSEKIYDSINQIETNPELYENKTVTVKGQLFLLPKNLLIDSQGHTIVLENLNTSEGNVYYINLDYEVTGKIKLVQYCLCGIEAKEYEPVSDCKNCSTPFEYKPHLFVAEITKLH